MPLHRAARLIVLGTLALVLASCGGADDTSILLTIRSDDFAAPADIDQLEIDVVGSESGGMIDQSFALGSDWPHTMSIRPGSSDSEQVTITVEGRQAGGFVVRHVATARFMPGLVVREEILLLGSCRGIRCPRGIDCVAGECLGVVLPMDAGPPDTGPDTGTPDTGPPDVGVEDAGPGDTGEPDAGGCAADTDCDDGVRCTADSCSAGVCVFAPDDTQCEDGVRCDPLLDCPEPSCDVDADCDDGDACTGFENCVGGACVEGIPITCDSGVPCVVGTCAPDTGECSFAPDDTLCDDGLVCNGDETCDMVLGCQPGVALDCDDADDCTGDVCSDASRMCVNATLDNDGDGFGSDACPAVGGVSADDCNDANPAVFPGAPEVCNGIDDDCDSDCDDAFTCCRGEVGPCTTTCDTTGTRVCGLSCSWGLCSPPAEICNGVDDDCNSVADDVFECVQGEVRACTTECGSAGTRTCDGSCALGACAPPDEICNGVDDDCDGTADEGFGCVAGSSTSCTTSCDNPGDSTGTITCDATCTPGACEPPSEGCTGKDDDCDGRTDETVECTEGEMQSCMTSCGSSGTQTCSAGCSFGACAPPAEVCNGADDDCDGRTDEGFTCVPGSTGTCPSGCGTTGSRTCNASCEWDACTPPVELCNGADDDCDASCDESFTCCVGETGACMTSCDTVGTRELHERLRLERLLAARGDLQRGRRRLQRRLRRRLHLLRQHERELHDELRQHRHARLRRLLQLGDLHPAERDLQRRGRRL